MMPLKFSKIFTLLILALGFWCYPHFPIYSASTALETSISDREPGSKGRPLLVKNLRGKPIMFLDERDKDYQKEIDTFKADIIKNTSTNRYFSIDLSRTTLLDDGVANLVRLLSDDVVTVDGSHVKPYDFIRQIDLSHTRFSDDGLSALRPLLERPDLKYINVSYSYASNLDSIRKLAHELFAEDASEETLERWESEIYNKLIWLPDTYFIGPEPKGSLRLPDYFIKPHKEFYGIK